MRYLLIGVVLITFLILWHLSKKHWREAVANIPGPVNVPILGSITIYPTLQPSKILKTLDCITSSYGPVIKLWVFNHLYILSADLKLNTQLLASSIHISKPNVYQILQPWLGNGMLMSAGKKWRSRRKAVTTTFHFSILKRYVEIFNRQANVLLNCLQPKADGRTAFDIYHYAAAAALDIITEAALGINICAQTDPYMEYTRAINGLVNIVAFKLWNVISHKKIGFSIVYPHIKLREMNLCKIVHSFTQKIISERQRALQDSMNGHMLEQTEYDRKDKKHTNLLDLLLRITIDGQRLSNDAIQEELDTYTTAGHETISIGISIAIYFVARYPNVQNKLLAELHRVLGADENIDISLNDLNNLKYTECVIKESLRLHPPIPFVARNIAEDFRYEHSRYGDGVIPAGADFIISVYYMMRDPKYFENPNDFIPERHDTDAGSYSNYAFIPFSAGSRNCIGQKFAMYEMKLLLAKMVLKYELLPLGEQMVPKVGVVLRSFNGMQLGLRQRS